MSEKAIRINPSWQNAWDDKYKWINKYSLKSLYYRILYEKYKERFFNYECYRKGRLIKFFTKYMKHFLYNHKNTKGSRDVDFFNAVKNLALNKDKITDKQRIEFLIQFGFMDSKFANNVEICKKAIEINFYNGIPKGELSPFLRK
jgi:hypothetical protein